jgi:hypothetical protein
MTIVRNLDERRERANNTIWRIGIANTKKIKERDFVDATNLQPDDIVINTRFLVFRVVKVTPKTITLAGIVNPMGDLTEVLEPKRMSHDTFSFTYRKVTMNEINRIKQLYCRLQFIKNFGKD